MKIRIDETIAKYGFPHGLRGSSPAPVLPVEAVAPVGGVEPCSAPTFYSLAAASGVSLLLPDAPSSTPCREGGECCPAPIQAFVDTWIAAPVRVSPVDYGPQYNGVGECPF